MIFYDTVGFIQDIPTDLIEAFKSTLSCVKNADLILNVCDLSGDYVSQSNVTDSILREIGVTSPVIKVYNKCDKISDFTFCDKDGIIISAASGEGVEELKERIEDYFGNLFSEFEIKVGFTEQENIFKLKKYAERFDVNYLEDGIVVSLRIRKSNLSKFSDYVKQEKSEED